MGPDIVEARTIGEAWLRVSRAILESGRIAVYDGERTRELSLLTIAVAAPAADDRLIAEHADPAWLAWMHDNFSVEKDVPELGGAESYAVRLFDYAGGGYDQVAHVVERLRGDPDCRSATITTFQPLTDTTYIPCVSMLDFWLPGDSLELVVYAHSLDFGKKASGNLVELARLQELVAGELDTPVGGLVVHVKSAHVYEPEWELMAELVERPGSPARARPAAAGTRPSGELRDS